MSATEILVVDDDPVVTSIVSSMLLNKGYLVSCIQSGRECLSSMRQKLSNKEALPRVILLDLLLNDMQGSQVLKELREIFSPSYVPVIMLSANTEGEMLEINTDAIPDVYLQKPFTSSEIIQAIESVLH